GMGASGIGSPASRGLATAGDALAHRVRYVAVCDVDGRHRDRAASIMKEKGMECEKYEDYRELLARKDIDAVTIAVPDHWHALTYIEAMKRGKDVYGEKPLSLTIEQGRAIVTAARKYER